MPYSANTSLRMLIIVPLVLLPFGIYVLLEIFNSKQPSAEIPLHLCRRGSCPLFAMIEMGLHAVLVVLVGSIWRIPGIWDTFSPHFQCPCWYLPRIPLFWLVVGISWYQGDLDGLSPWSFFSVILVSRFCHLLWLRHPQLTARLETPSKVVAVLALGCVSLAIHWWWSLSRPTVLDLLWWQSSGFQSCCLRTAQSWFWMCSFSKGPSFTGLRRERPSDSNICFPGLCLIVTSYPWILSSILCSLGGAAISTLSSQADCGPTPQWRAFHKHTCETSHMLSLLLTFPFRCWHTSVPCQWELWNWRLLLPSL